MGRPMRPPLDRPTRTDPAVDAVTGAGSFHDLPPGLRQLAQRITTESARWADGVKKRNLKAD